MLKEALALARRRVVSAFFYSLEGFNAAWHSEEAIKVEIALLPVFLGLALYLKDDGVSRALLIGVLLLVVIVELLNTAIEKLADFVHPDYHLKIGIIKDISAGAAVFAAFVAIIIGGIIYLPKILQFF